MVNGLVESQARIWAREICPAVNQAGEDSFIRTSRVTILISNRFIAEQRASNDNHTAWTDSETVGGGYIIRFARSVVNSLPKQRTVQGTVLQSKKAVRTKLIDRVSGDDDIACVIERHSVRCVIVVRPAAVTTVPHECAVGCGV